MDPTSPTPTALDTMSLGDLVALARAQGIHVEDEDETDRGQVEKDNTDWIFSIPEGLSFPSDFLETRQICKAQKKWLMVNIQDHEEFASHRLNKDVWSNETILTLLRGNFIFWQRNKTLRQARYYIEKYNLEGQVLPHMAILDPRTGAPLLKVIGFVEPEDLSMALVEFLENNSIDQVKAPALKTIGLGNIAHQGYNDTPRKDGGGASEKASPDNSVSTYGRAAAGDASYSRESAYESFGSEEYVYDDDDDIAQEAAEGDEGVGGSEEVQVPPEPDAGNGVTQVQFRLPGGGTTARRFWLKDRVSLLFRFVRTTGDEASSRPFDLLSGHPPSSLLRSKVLTLEAANLANTAIMVRWL
eukprot:g6547.t1